MGNLHTWWKEHKKSTIYIVIGTIIAFVIKISNLKDAWYNLFPHPEIQYCENETNVVLGYVADIKAVVSKKNIFYGEILTLKQSTQKLIQKELEEKKYKCGIHDKFESINIQVKDMLLSSCFSNIEYLSKNDSDKTRDKVKILCEVTKNFMKETNMYSTKEMNIINSTLKQLEK